MTTTNTQLLKDAFDRHRERTFGNSSLTVYGTTPDLGETLLGTFAVGWKGHRVIDATRDITERDSSEWQFQVIASDNWDQTGQVGNQLFMKKGSVVMVGTKRWKVRKIQEPIGQIFIWKIRAQQQK